MTNKNNQYIKYRNSSMAYSLVKIITKVIRSLCNTFYAVLFLFNVFICNVAAAESGLSGYHSLRFFQAVMEYVKQEYVADVDEQKLIESAIQGMLTSLDPHSMYLDQKTYNEMKIATKGEFGGLGIEMTMENGMLRIISPYEDGPAFRAGIKIGDSIIAIDGEMVKGMSINEAVDKLRGEPGTSVNIKIYRENYGVLDTKIVREVIKLVPVNAKLVGGKSVGYFNVSNFNERTASIIKKEYANLIKENPSISGIVLDLRWNPGGLLEQAKEVADLFLREGVIVSIKSRNSEMNQVFCAENSDITGGMPIVVLINGGSASAAEIVAGALQENKRALVVGTKSFGKGSVQKVIPLSSGGAIKLTTALYYTPSGTSIQAAGITPDIIVPEAIVKQVEDGSNIIGSEASLKGHLRKKSDSMTNAQKENIRTLMNLDESQDFQLLRAIDTVKVMALYR